MKCGERWRYYGIGVRVLKGFLLRNRESPTVKGLDYFLLFRFYEPTEKFFVKSYKLNDLKKVK